MTSSTAHIVPPDLSIQDVVLVIANQDIVVVISIAIPCRIKQDECFHAHGEAEINSGLDGVAIGSSFDDDIVRDIYTEEICPSTANKGIPSGTAVQGVISIKPLQAIVPTIAREDIVSGIADAIEGCALHQHQLFHVFREDNRDGGTDQIHTTVHGFDDPIAGIIDDVGVIPIATDHGVRPWSAIDPVRPGSSLKPIVSRPADQRFGQKVFGWHEVSQSHDGIRLEIQIQHR